MRAIPMNDAANEKEAFDIEIKETALPERPRSKAKSKDKEALDTAPKPILLNNLPFPKEQATAKSLGDA